jgi:hypothetical protein
MHLDEIRLTAEEGTLLRDSVKNDDVLANSLVIRMPTGTVFPLSLDETMRLERLWGLRQQRGQRWEQKHLKEKKSSDRILGARGPIGCGT